MKKLYSVGLGFSSNCNMNCPFCYSRAKRNEGRDLSLDVWYDFSAEMRLQSEVLIMEPAKIRPRMHGMR